MTEAQNPLAEEQARRIRALELQLDKLARITVLATGQKGADRCMLRATANQSIPNSTSTVVAFNTADFDNAGLRVGSTVRVKEPGHYGISATVYFDTSNVGERWVRLTLNGGFFGREYVGPPNTVPGSATIISVAGFKELAANDVIGLQVLQSSGGALLIPAATGLPNLDVVKISA